MKKYSILLLFSAMPLLCQANQGELRIQVVDPAGLGVKTTVLIVSRENQYLNALATSIQEIWTCSAFHSADTRLK